MTSPKTVTEWIAQMRADEAAMTRGPWATHTWDGDPKDVEHGILYANGHDSTVMDPADAAGIVAARNSLRRMVDVVAAAKERIRNRHHDTCGKVLTSMADVPYPCSCGQDELVAALDALVRP